MVVTTQRSTVGNSRVSVPGTGIHALMSHARLRAMRTIRRLRLYSISTIVMIGSPDSRDGPPLLQPELMRILGAGRRRENAPEPAVAAGESKHLNRRVF
jgi:hypothetical protein